ncbi:MAG TPA: hypothetical protein VFT58_01840 [Nitrososphaera sp.]|nr:hypothetical protein [Nitrososphaera sp.]
MPQYRRLLELEGGLLEPGTLAADRYDYRNPAHVARFAGRIAEHAALGSRYSVVRDPRDPSRFLGLVKTSPSDVVHGMPPGECYVNDIVVRRRGRGLGRLMLHAGLVGSGIDPAAGSSLEAFDHDKRVSDWYQRLGYSPVGASADPFEAGGIQVAQTVYHTEEPHSLGTVLGVLEASDPALAIHRTANLRY